MKQPSQTIEIDRENQMVQVRVRGFFTPEDASWAGEEVREAIRSLGDGAGRHLTLYDFTETDIAPQATIDRLRQTFDHAAVRRIWARKVAFVTPSSLLRRQVERLRDVRPDIGIFADREAAVAWLLEPTG